MKLSRALPGADGEVSGEEHVHEVLELVGDLEAEALAHHHVPGWSEPIDEEVFNLSTELLGSCIFTVSIVLYEGNFATPHGENEERCWR